MFAYFMFQSLLRGVGQVTIPLYIVAATVVINFFLDPVFIFGKFGFPALGVIGAALATLLAQGFAAVAGIALLVSGRYGIKLTRARCGPILPSSNAPSSLVILPPSSNPRAAWA